MAGRYKAYPKYKDSGVEWMGGIPAEWIPQRVKYLFSLGRGRVISEQELVDDGRFPVYSSQTKNDGCLGYIQTFDFDCEQITWTTDGANAGTVFLRRGKHNCTNVCGTLRPKDSASSTKYLLYCLQYSTQFYKRPDTNGAKIMNGEMAEIFVPLAPLPEQKQIARFLDHETGKIDALIEKQQALIALLQEKRQAVISHAVTKGLNPEARMKDSGVEWLGDVPEGWEVAAISSLSHKITNGYVGPTRDIFHDSGVRYLQSLHIKKNQIDFHTPYYVSEEWSRSKEKSVLREGDVLVVQTGDIGQVAAVSKEFEGCNCHALIIIAAMKALDGFFLSWLLNSDFGYHSLKSIQTGALHPHLNCNYVKTIKVPVPTLEEQRRIVEYVNAADGKYELLTQKAHDQINLLQERRTALISAAVTGKIDVRDWEPACAGGTEE